MVFQGIHLFNFVIRHYRAVFTDNGDAGIFIHGRFMQMAELFLQIPVIIQGIVHHMNGIQHGFPIAFQHIFADKIVRKNTADREGQHEYRYEPE